MANHRGTDAPGTVTPTRVWVSVIAMVFLIAIMLYTIFSLFWTWAILLAILAVIRPIFFQYVRPFTAQMVIDAIFTKDVRCLRRGLNLIAPGETKGAIIDLKVDIKEVKEETYTTKVSLVKGKYVYSLAPDASEDRQLVKFASFEIDAIKQAARSLFSMLISDYLCDKESDKDILNKSRINRVVFYERPDDLSSPFIQVILDFEEEHGVVVEEIRLEDVDYDEKTQAARGTVSKSDSFVRSVKVLKDGGMDPVKAENLVRQMMDLPGFSEYLIHLDAKGLEKLEHFSMLGGLGGGDKGAKKGGKK